MSIGLAGIVAISILLLLAGISAVISYLEYRLTFRGIKYRGFSPKSWGIFYEDVCWSGPGGTRMHGWYVPILAAKRALLIFHGNGYAIDYFYESGKNAEKMRLLQRSLRASLFFIDQPTYGQSRGRVAMRDLHCAAQGALDFLRERGFAPQKIAAIGHSLGGANAVQLASRMRLEALILIVPFTDFNQIARYHLGTLRYLLYRLIRSVPIFDRVRYNATQEISGAACPVFLIHGGEDDVIPISSFGSLFKAVKAPKHIEVLSDCGHVMPVDAIDTIIKMHKQR